MSELQDRLAKNQGHLELSKKLVSLKSGLQAVKNADSQDIPDSIKADLKRAQAMLMWDSLPDEVTVLNLGGGVLVTRSEEDPLDVPENKYRVMDLQLLDRYGSQIAASLKKEWEPVFAK